MSEENLETILTIGICGVAGGLISIFGGAVGEIKPLIYTGIVLASVGGITSIISGTYIAAGMIGEKYKRGFKKNESN